METAAEQMDIDVQLARDPSVRQILEQRVNAWKIRAARYESEPESGEGRKERMAKAKALEQMRRCNSPVCTNNKTQPPPRRVAKSASRNALQRSLALATLVETGLRRISSSMRTRSFWKSTSALPLNCCSRETWMEFGSTKLLLTKTSK